VVLDIPDELRAKVAQDSLREREGVRLGTMIVICKRLRSITQSSVS
jgi:hypothetical protein